MSQGSQARRARFLELGGVVPADGEGSALLDAIFDSGEFLPELLLADVGLLGALAGDPYLRRPKPAEVIAAEVRMAAAGARDFADLQRRLRLVRRAEILRLGARELGWGTTEEVASSQRSRTSAWMWRWRSVTPR
jgi:glutamine synthetase adenylyltransferase